MQKITLLCVGSLKSPWVREGCADFIERLKHSVDLRIEELPASREKDSDRQRIDESTRLMAALRKGEGDVWVLDERGKGMTTAGFAAALGHSTDAGIPLRFVLGGAFGLTEDVRGAGRLLRLSDMTLPHELCRLLFLEQLYRAVDINKGGKYHHA